MKGKLWGLFFFPSPFEGQGLEKKETQGFPPVRQKPHPRRQGFTCEDVSESVAASDLQRWVLGAKDIQEESREAADDSQEAEGSDDPEQQDRLRVHAIICEVKKKWQPLSAGKIPLFHPNHPLDRATGIMIPAPIPPSVFQ